MYSYQLPCVFQITLCLILQWVSWRRLQKQRPHSLLWSPQMKWWQTTSATTPLLSKWKLKLLSLDRSVSVQQGSHLGTDVVVKSLMAMVSHYYYSYYTSGLWRAYNYAIGASSNPTNKQPIMRLWDCIPVAFCGWTFSSVTSISTGAPIISCFTRRSQLVKKICEVMGTRGQEPQWLDVAVTLSVFQCMGQLDYSSMTAPSPTWEAMTVTGAVLCKRTIQSLLPVLMS